MRVNAAEHAETLACLGALEHLCSRSEAKYESDSSNLIRYLTSSDLFGLGRGCAYHRMHGIIGSIF